MQQYNCCSVFVTFNFTRQWWILWVLQMMHPTRYKYGNSRCSLQLLTLLDFFILSTLWCFYACHCDFKISFSNKKKSLWLLVLGIILLGILVLCSTFKNWVVAILLQLYRIIYRFLWLCVSIMCLFKFSKYCLWMIRRPAGLQQNNIIYKNKQKHKTPRSNWINHKTFNLISPMVWTEHQEKFLQESNFKV